MLRRPPATIDDELDPVVSGINCGMAQRTEESWIKVRYTRDLDIEDRRAIGDGTASLAQRTTVHTASLARRTRVLTPKDVAG